ncbi:MAG TPA: hypothetical protein VI298_16540 [Geobacteraceae bacterium]
MKFEFNVSRATMGNNISVNITADSGEEITNVATDLDGFGQSDENLDPPQVYYSHDFNEIGTASIGESHVFTATATDQKGKDQVATKRWNDPF